MGYVLAVLYGGVAALGLALLLLASWSIYYDFTWTKIPPGLRQPFKLRLLHVGIVMIFTLVGLSWFKSLRRASEVCACNGREKKNKN